MAIEDEDGTNDSNVFASLMPNLFSRLQHCNDTVSEQEFQEIHRLLNLARSDDDLIKGNLFMNQPLIPLSKQREKDNGLTQEEVKKRPSPLIKSDYASGKENALPTKLPQRNKLSRRERSSRVTTHRKPFVVDIRNFGSFLNSNALGKCKKPQDVHAFWEAADEREASEAIMSKLRGRIDQNSGNGDITLRRLGVRRKNSQRTTTRLRRFAVELPACGEQVQSLDEEQLEEEEDATQESSFTFLSNPEFRAQNYLFELPNAEKNIKASQLLSSIQSAEKCVEIVDLDGTAKSSCQEEDDNDTLSDGKSPLVNAKDAGQCSFGLKDIAASKDGSDECEKPSQVPDILSDAPSHQADPISSLAADSQDKNVAEVIDTGNELEIKATPYNRNVAPKRTPFTSPTPPSNPLAAFGLRKDNVVEDISKRRLDFDDNNMNSTTLQLDSSAPIMQISSVLQNPSASPELPQAHVEVTPPSDVTLVHISPVLQNPSASPEVPQAYVEVTSPADAMHEENAELAEEVNTKAPDVAEEANPKTPDVVPTVATKIPEQNAKKPLKKAIGKRKKPTNDRRHSLAGAGTDWNQGQRRSTRIRSRPLEWWRGERFLLGRVHKSLATVIGIKYSSPPPCWPKRGTKAPTFKVESYVSEEYAKYVEFAALC